jgi:hypothetical protein
MHLPRIGIKGWLTIGVLVALLALLAWDHTFEGKGWVPSLGANLITMVITVVVLDALFKQRQKRGASAILRTSFMDVGEALGYIAQLYVHGADPSPEFWWNHNIEGWQRTLEKLQRDLSYCATDLDHPLRKNIKDLEDRARQYAEMGWGDFENENLITSKHVLETWALVREIQQALYPGDKNMTAIFDQIQEEIDGMVAKFKPYW